MRSISHRIYRTSALISLASLIVVFVGVTWVSEDLESTMLRVELAQERDFLLGDNFDPSSPIIRETSGLTLAYIPTVKSSESSANPRPDPAVPAIFSGLETDFSGEIYKNDDTYLVTIQTLQHGVLYLARDITHFEQREWLFRLALLVVIGLVAIVTALLSVFEAKRIVKPLTTLSKQIEKLPVGSNMSGLPKNWQDAELQSIANSFNLFVAQLEAYVQREKSLLNMASHEFRTPLAVISGALDILEARGNLNAQDQTTLGRVRRATTEMQSNVNALLTLARKETEHTASDQIVSLASTIHQTIQDLSVNFPVDSRLSFKASNPVDVRADPALVQMLLRNLLQNALQHTHGRVYVELYENTLEIRDEGPGLTEEARALLAYTGPARPPTTVTSGLGLYLVTLIAERLNWPLELAKTIEQGTTIRIHINVDAMNAG
ncbi:MAG TPA: histidine kinase [Pusillimonas sp.]|jgi:signal transduction histidine kinase|nr:histidine kinase [Pusillimonas sp.]|tara:strand:- start:189217 stop:190521 length:1305 start_codon:yes stop_codon:yes gene_type:complete